MILDWQQVPERFHPYITYLGVHEYVILAVYMFDLNEKKGHPMSSTIKDMEVLDLIEAVGKPTVCLRMFWLKSQYSIEWSIKSLLSRFNRGCKCMLTGNMGWFHISLFTP